MKKILTISRPDGSVLLQQTVIDSTFGVAVGYIYVRQGKVVFEPGGGMPIIGDLNFKVSNDKPTKETE